MSPCRAATGGQPGPQIGIPVPAPDPSKMPPGARWPTDLQPRSHLPHERA